MVCRILLVDDHQIFREGLKGLLERSGHCVVGEAADGRDGVRMARMLRPDIAVLDLSIPHLNGLDLTREIVGLDAGITCILLTMHADKHYVLHALKAGAKGYVLKTQAAEDLVSAIAVVRSGSLYLSPAVAKGVIATFMNNGHNLTEDPLTSRERQILQLVAEGNTSKKIATLLNLSTKTTEAHRYNIMHKLNIHDVAGLVRYAIGRGIIQVENLRDR